MNAVRDAARWVVARDRRGVFRARGSGACIGPAVFACSLLLGLAGSPAAAGPAPLRGPAVAPVFRARDLEGRSLDLAALHARGPVVVDFWATWCKPCIASLPELERMRQALAGRGVSFVGVSVDGPRNYSKVRPFVARLGLRFPIVLDEDGALQEKFHVRAVPTTFVIDRDGRIAKVFTGYRPGEASLLRATIEGLLGSAADAGSDSARTSPRP
jgi:peroxiredoxin